GMATGGGPALAAVPGAANAFRGNRAARRGLVTAVVSAGRAAAAPPGIAAHVVEAGVRPAEAARAEPSAEAAPTEAARAKPSAEAAATKTTEAAAVDGAGRAQAQSQTHDDVCDKAFHRDLPSDLKCQGPFTNDTT